MTATFGRRVRIEFGRPGELGSSFENLRVSFKVDKVSGSEPDAAEFQVYNLSATSRAKLEEPGIVVRLLASYGSAEPALLFAGDVEEVTHQWAIPDVATTIKATDGGRALRFGRVAETFRGPVEARRVFERLVERLGVPLVYADPSLPSVEFQSGYVATGPIRRVLDDLAATLAASWSVQDGGVILLARGATSTATGPLLSPETGLVGSPEKVDDGEGKIKATALLVPRLAPGGRFRLESRSFAGFYRATRVEHVGDSGWDNAFYTTIEATSFEVEE